MDCAASSFTLRKNAKRAAEAMIRKGTAPVVDYGIEPNDKGRFEIVWKAKVAPTTDEVEITTAAASSDEPAAALPTEAASRAPKPAGSTLWSSYKVDRLTRSLADFARLVELFDAEAVSFVSLTPSRSASAASGTFVLRTRAALNRRALISGKFCLSGMAISA